MLPVAIDVGRVRVMLVGSGERLRRRLRLLDAAGAAHLEVYDASPLPELVTAAGPRLRRRLPQAREVRRTQLLFLVGLAASTASRLHGIAVEAGVLVNIEDEIDGSDFHSSAVVRRGELTIAISTGGKSPGLAAAVRRQIEQWFGHEWGGHLERAAALRSCWRASGEGNAAVARRTALWLEREVSVAAK